MKKNFTSLAPQNVKKKKKKLRVSIEQVQRAPHKCLLGRICTITIFFFFFFFFSASNQYFSHPSSISTQNLSFWKKINFLLFFSFFFNMHLRDWVLICNKKKKKKIRISNKCIEPLTNPYLFVSAQFFFFFRIKRIFFTADQHKICHFEKKLIFLFFFIFFQHASTWLSFDNQFSKKKKKIEYRASALSPSKTIFFFFHIFSFFLSVLEEIFFCFFFLNNFQQNYYYDLFFLKTHSAPT